MKVRSLLIASTALMLTFACAKKSKKGGGGDEQTSSTETTTVTSGDQPSSGENTGSSTVVTPTATTQTTSTSGSSTTSSTSSGSSSGSTSGSTDNGSSGGGSTGGGTTTAPIAPTITTPSTSTALYNSGSFVIAGACTTGNSVSLSGDIISSEVTSPASVLNTTCNSSAYSFSITKAEGVFTIVVKQSDGTSTSPTASVTITVDLTPPGEPQITNPATSPYTSGDSTLTIEGICEVGATVNLSGDTSGTKTCSDGSFSFDPYTASTGGTYTFSVSQTDAAGNASGTTVQEWTYDTSTPATPIYSVPSTTSSFTSSSSITLSGSCTNTMKVYLTGDATAGEVTTPAGATVLTCSSGAFSFVIDKSAAGDGTYQFNVYQENQTTFAVSASASRTVTVDQVAPASPTIVNPGASPYTGSGPLFISGTCEAGASVSIDTNPTTPVTCSSTGQYTFNFDESADAQYNYVISQTDKAGNTSLSGANLTWNRDSTVTPVPTITSPSQNPYISNANTITISGTCVTGMDVTLGGDVSTSDVSDPANQLTTTCNGSTYSFTVNKSADNTYNFTLKQVNGANESATISQSWLRDTAAPDVSLDSPTPPLTNFGLTATFNFSSTDSGASFQCQLDAGTWSSCVSPKTYASLSNTAHTFAVRSKDLAGNVSSDATYSWMQAASKTVALWHLDDQTGGNHLTDDSNYNENSLTNSGTTEDSSGKFSQGRSFTAASSQTMSSANQSSQATLTSTLTVEGWIKIATIPANNSFYGIVSKAAAGDLGFELLFKKHGGGSPGNCRLEFHGSTDGSAFAPVIAGSNFSCPSTGVWYHVAVVFNKGSVTAFFNGASVGTGTIGTAGSSSLFASTAPLKLGNTYAGGQYFDGSMDEFRISQVVRYSAAFTPPVAAFTAD